ncbi:cyanuric acid amidohydrolase [Variovorax paradoxus]|jgi:cyanuric acid amidohydrolase|uniref:cyanuric acid amidohydrolase n=1 Tax=Variovorax paradoxus TaxID=34073 RepID=UPI0029C7F739|nr:ring-opening amidohydrolase [Variovorax paradoxus]WPH20125.1 ring-opening amidohydrolase [Variovorax paradoxus]
MNAPTLLQPGTAPAQAATRPRLAVRRLPMAHPGDLSALAALFDEGAIEPAQVVAVIGKTEGNGGVNDFTRGYFTQTLMSLLAARLGRPAAELLRELPCILSGGTEGVLSPHYVVFARSGRPAADAVAGPGPGALAIGTAVSAPLPAQHVGRWAQVASVAGAVREAMRDAGIARAEDVAFVQVKCPCVTAARAQAAAAAGHTVLTADSGRSMAAARAAGAFGVAIALGELPDDPALEAAMLVDFERFSRRASISSGVEVEANEVIVLGHSAAWEGTLRMACAPMRDALDIGAVAEALRPLGMNAAPQLGAADAARVAAVFVKCEPDRRGHVRGARHTMLDDTDINAQRHIRGAIGGMVAGVLGDARIFVSGGAEHQGPDGGGLVAVIAHAA